MERRTQQKDVLSPRPADGDRFQVYLATVKLDIEVMGVGGRPPEVFLGPVSANIELFGNFSLVIKVGEEGIEQVIADFGEEGAHDHVELLQLSLPLAVGQDALDDDHHQQHFQGQKGQVADHIDKDVVHIAEDKVVDEIEDSGERQKGQR